MRIWLLFLLSMPAALASEEFFLEAELGPGNEVRIEGWNREDVLILTDTGFQYQGLPTCVLDSKKDSLTTPDCPFAFNYNILDRQDEGIKERFVQIALDELSLSPKKYVVSSSGEKFKISSDLCEQTNCRIVTIPGGKSLSVNLVTAFRVATSAFDRGKIITERPEIPSDYKFKLPSDFLGQKESYFQFKGSFLVLKNPTAGSGQIYDAPSMSGAGKGVNWLSVDNQFEPFEAWVKRGVPRRDQVQSNVVRLKIEAAFPDKKGFKLSGEKPQYLKIEGCFSGEFECEIVHIPKTAYEIALTRQSELIKNKSSKHLSVLIKKLLPCVKNKDFKCIRAHFFRRDDSVEGEGDWIPPVLPLYDFTEADLAELEACLNHSNLLPHLMGSKGSKKICAFSPFELTSDKKVKLQGIVEPEDFTSKYLYGMPFQKSVLEEGHFEIPEEYLAESAESEESNIDGVPVLSNGKKLWDQMKSNYRFLDYVSEDKKTRDIKLLELRWEKVYQNRISDYSSKKRGYVHPHFFSDPAYVKSFFQGECYADLQHLNTFPDIDSIKLTFVENVGKLGGFSGKCIPSRFLSDPKVIAEVKKVEQWVSLFLPRKYYGEEFYEVDLFRENHTLESRWNLPQLTFTREEAGILEIAENQGALFKEFPLIIKYLPLDFPFHEKALAEGLGWFFLPERLFTNDQKKLPVIKSFLAAKQPPETEKKFREYLLKTQFGYIEMPFALMTPEMINDDDFQIKISAGKQLESLVELSYYRTLSPKLEEILLNSCRAGKSGYTEGKLWRIPWLESKKEMYERIKTNCSSRR